MGKVSIAWKNIFRPTPKLVARVLWALKGIIGAVAISSYVMDNKPLGFWLLVGGAVLDEFAKFIDIGDENSKQNL